MHFDSLGDPEGVIPTLRVPATPELDHLEMPRGLAGEFAVDGFTGAATYLIPLPLSPGRPGPQNEEGFQPSLNLRYNSTFGNGPFGRGWELDLPSISRRTEPQIPIYRDADDDVYLVGDDELVPSLRLNGDWVDDRFTVGEYVVQRYRRRTEQRHDRIERWQHQPSGQTHWRVVDENNITSLFGATDESRISDPSDSSRIVSWLITETFDDRGSIIRYAYKRENLEGVDVEEGVERHRRDRPDAQGGGRYLKRIQYGNAAPHDRNDWYFEVVFDYGDHDTEAPTISESGEWKVRSDPFSSYRAGFETRVWRLCQRVLMFHNFAELGNSPTLVNAVDFSYEDNYGFNVLASATYTGYMKRNDGQTQQRSLPSLDFSYQRPDFNDTVHTIDSEVVVGALLDERSGASWTDLQDEALPGLAMRVGGSWCFVRNYGGNEFGEPQAVPDTHRLEVADGGVVDLAESTVTHESAYQPLATSRGKANVSQDDPHVGYLDLNGDSADDVVVADEHVIRWYPSQGEDGFGDPIVVKLDDSISSRPRCLHADNKQSLWIADMTGDGLYDIVRVRAGEVSYWPHRGRGRFGDRIVIDNSPLLPENSAGRGRVLFGDLTGSGSADLIWIDNGEVRYWENIHGNTFGPPRRVTAPGIAPGGPGLDTVDLFGRGSSCILWIDQSAGVPSLRYIAPVGERRPLLLSKVANNRGCETRLSYVSAAELRRRDRVGGIDQLTSLPVPLQVVERSETRDRLAGTRALTRYVFRHGAYDVDSQRFIGFAYQETWRSAPLEDYQQPGLFAHEPAMPVDGDRRSTPTLTKSWRHTGLLFEGDELTAELSMEYFADPQSHHRAWLPESLMPTGLRPRDLPSAHVSLRGLVVREEFYDVASGTAVIPMWTKEFTAWVRQVQPGRGNQSGSFDARQRERLHVIYDGDSSDPRILHSIALAIDEFGNEQLHADIAYVRRHPANPMQTRNLVTVTERSFVNRIDQSTWYRLRVPFEATVWQLIDVTGASNDLYEPEEIQLHFDTLTVVSPGTGIEAPHKVTVEKCRYLYWTNDVSKVVSADSLESKALPARVDRLGLSDAFVRQLFDERDVSDVLRFEGGYEHEDGLWWAPGATVTYSRANFYLPTGWRDALGRETKVRYNAPSLAIEEIEDALGNTSRYLTHPRTLKPWQFVDQNGNVVAYRFDALGQVLSKATMGKPDEVQGDSVALGVLEASAKDDPTAVVTYGFGPGDGNETPLFIRIRHRERHRDDKTKLVDRYSYFDGSNRAIASSMRSDDGPWQVTNYCLRDSNGAVIGLAVPFLSDSSWPDQTTATTALDDGNKFKFDAMGRVVRKENPGGTLETFEYSPWQQIHEDANDMSLESGWYADRQGSVQGRASEFAERAKQQYEARAAAIAAVHAHTPETELVDGFGRAIVTKRTVGSQNVVETTKTLDWRGALVATMDSRGTQVTRLRRDLLGRVVRSDHVDAGVVQILLAATGEMLRCWDPGGRSTRYRYDALGRRTHTYFNSGVGPEVLSERTIWGGGEVAIPDVKDRNLIGAPYMRFSGAGVETIELCDWAGNTLRCSLQTLAKPDQPPDWAVVDEVVHAGQLVSALDDEGNSPLNDDVWTNETVYDALGRLAYASSIDVGTVNFEYGAQCRAESMRVQMHQSDETVVLEEVRYDAYGRPSIMRFGNGAWVRRHFNSSQQLANISAAARGNDELLQDTSIVYDANGNVVSISERGELSAAYTYDGLDRLIRAEGIAPAESSDKTTRRYSASYVLDSEGNVEESTYKIDQIERKTHFDLQAGGNRLRAVRVLDGAPETSTSTYQYDEAGNVIRARDRSYRWNHQGRLVVAEIDGGVRVLFSYDQAGRLVRRVIERPGNVVDDYVYFDQFLRHTQKRDGELTLEEHSVLFWLQDIPIAVAERIVTDSDNSIANRAAMRFQLVDHLNSVVAELAATGNVISSEMFMPFGTAMPAGAPSNLTKRLGFRGESFDRETLLYGLAGGWYDPAIGRYINPASIYSCETNVYLFNKGNPQRPQQH